MEKYLKRKAPSTSNASNNTIDISDLPWDPSERLNIITCNPNQIDEIRRKYLVDKAYCLPCYLFRDPSGTDAAFVTEGFNSWSKKERFKLHEGRVKSNHHKAVAKCEDLLNQNQSIVVAFLKQSELAKTKYHMRLTASVEVIKYVKDDGDNGATRLQASGLLSYFKTFEFLFYMHLILTILELTNSLSQALQRKDQDTLEALDLIRTTKGQLQMLRENGFDQVLEKRYSFCDKHNIAKLDMAEGYVNTRNPRKKMNISNRHYYNYDLFNTVLDMQIREFGDRFCEISTELLQNMAALNP
ncbi:hypothetical protein OSB04_un001879, partial [Centaurea solstitialis]